MKNKLPVGTGRSGNAKVDLSQGVRKGETIDMLYQRRMDGAAAAAAPASGKGNGPGKAKQ
jgi:hypothetical protein